MEGIGGHRRFLEESRKMGIGPVEESDGEAGKQGVAHLALGAGGIIPTPRCPA